MTKQVLEVMCEDCLESLEEVKRYFDICFVIKVMHVSRVTRKSLS